MLLGELEYLCRNGCCLVLMLPACQRSRKILAALYLGGGSTRPWVNN